MSKKIGSLEAEFLTAAARLRDLLYAAVTHEPLLSDDILHSVFVANDRGIWMDCGDVDWKCVGMTVVKNPIEKMLAISEDGDVYTYVGGTTATESITPPPAALRGVTTIDGKAVAFGMRRQVYERVDEGVWRSISAPDLKEGEVGGFEAVCGFSRKEVYAVGWRGEIWRFDGAKWSNSDSPVNVILTGATVHSDGFVYACGQNGSIVRGKGDAWQVIAHGQTIEDFWGILSFSDRVFVVSFSSLYVLNGNQLDLVDLSQAPAGTFHTLTQADGVMWSVGGEDVLSFDGTDWTKAL